MPPERFVLAVLLALVVGTPLAACATPRRGAECDPCAPVLRASPANPAPSTSAQVPAAPPPAPLAAPTPAPAPTPAAAAPDPDAASLPPEVVAVEKVRPWRVIVVHHSAGHVGGAARFDVAHRARGWDGVGYDFVVGNGTDTPDGAIETTPRWREQRDGAHVKGWNDLAIGVCLVGNFEEEDPTPAQLDAAARLVRHLRRRFAVPPERVVGHGALGTTLCPGRRLSIDALRRASDPAAAPGAAAVAAPPGVAAPAAPERAPVR